VGVDYNIIATGIHRVSAAGFFIPKKETLALWDAIAARYSSVGKYSFQFWDELIDFTAM
jgi:hypothetical protein